MARLARCESAVRGSPAQHWCEINSLLQKAPEAALQDISERNDPRIERLVALYMSYRFLDLSAAVYGLSPRHDLSGSHFRPLLPTLDPHRLDAVVRARSLNFS